MKQDGEETAQEHLQKNVTVVLRAVVTQLLSETAAANGRWVKCKVGRKWYQSLCRCSLRSLKKKFWATSSCNRLKMIQRSIKEKNVCFLIKWAHYHKISIVGIVNSKFNSLKRQLQT
jgi:hypothetical protein